MAAVLFHEPVFATIVESGDKLYFYEVLTTTDLTVYLDAALTTPATQPVVADSAGRFPPIYIDATGNPPKAVLTDTIGVAKWTCPEYPINDLSAISQDVAQLELDGDAVAGDLLIAASDIDQLQTTAADHEARIAAFEGDTSLSGLQSFAGKFLATAGPVGSLQIPYGDGTYAIVVNWGQLSVPAVSSATQNFDTPVTTSFTALTSYFNSSSAENTTAVESLAISSITVFNGSAQTRTVSWVAFGVLLLP